MPRNLTEIERDAIELPRLDRALLVEYLLTTLDQGEDIDAEELWPVGLLNSIPLLW